MGFLHKKAAAFQQLHVTADEVGKAFAEYHEELEWLALFLTGDAKLAETCVVDARALATNQNQVFAEWLEHWARRATICCAAGMQQENIRHLAAAYERQTRPQPEFRAMSPGMAEAIRNQTEVLVRELDVLSRFALIIHGVERYSLSESALLLDVSRGALDAAYSAGLDYLEAQSSEDIVDVGDALADC